MLQGNPYIKTVWQDHIVDLEYNEVIQEGTRFTATRANNIEEGIFNSYYWLKKFYDEMIKLRIQLEMIGRVPINNGTFFDPIDTEGDTKALTLLKSISVVQGTLSIGNTAITVQDGSLFEIGHNITILDDVNNEAKVITNVVGNVLTVSALTKSYKKGAFVFRSNVVVRDNKLNFGTWGTYKVSLKEVI